VCGGHARGASACARAQRRRAARTRRRRRPNWRRCASGATRWRRKPAAPASSAGRVGQLEAQGEKLHGQLREAEARVARAEAELEAARFAARADARLPR
jgi:hypothetical protein